MHEFDEIKEVNEVRFYVTTKDNKRHMIKYSCSGNLTLTQEVSAFSYLPTINAQFCATDGIVMPLKKAELADEYKEKIDEAVHAINDKKEDHTDGFFSQEISW